MLDDDDDDEVSNFNKEIIRKRRRKEMLDFLFFLFKSRSAGSWYEEKDNHTLK